jgi:signal transduction histidine kinase/CheY-like chemotaxis protein
MSARVLTVVLKYEDDVVIARQRARQLARLLGFDTQDQTRIATAVSEIARNAFRYAGGGTVEFAVEGRTAPQLFETLVSDRGRGIADLASVLEGRYRSTTGMGLGIIGAKRLMDQFEIASAPGRGTQVLLRKLLPPGAPFVGPTEIAAMGRELAREAPRGPLEEIQRQNQELLQALEELRIRKEQLEHLNRELEDTNRGVVALYAELDEKADHLRRADELKSRFLSNMSHEFRTPLNSITALSHLLLERMDGPLTPEQEKQVGFIRQGARDLTELVNDLLDLAKVEAGKVTVRPVEFAVESLFGALRGMLRPLLVNESLRLVFEPAAGIPPLHTDEGKVSQILRNFISNALKYTERGEVLVSATLADGGAAVAFSVADTGIGIAPEDQERIFEEFAQVEHTLQSRVKGTGLGLPLARKLTQLLGGRITLVSEPGIGSTFTATIPCVFAAPVRIEAEAEAAPEAAPLGRPVLVVENDPRVLSIYDRYFRESEFRMIPARSLRDARRALAMEEPEAIILDILLDGEEAWNFLAELRSKPATQAIPVAVVSNVDDRRKALALGADSYALKPVTREWFLGELERLAGGRRVPEALIIDDDDVARYLLKRLLSQVRCRVTEMPNGVDGLRAARDRHPDIIFLDLVMPDVSGFDLLSQLKADPASADIPVVVVTSKVLEPDERSELERRAVAVLSKAQTSSDDALAVLQETWMKAGLRP